MSNEQNKAIVRRLFEISTKGQEAFLAARPELFSANEVLYLAGMPPLNYETHTQFDRAFYAAFPDAQFAVDELVADGDKVVARMTLRATHEGTFQELPPTGKSISVTGIAIYRIAGGKIEEEWIVLDQLGMMQQLGVIPAPQAQ